MNKEEAKKNAGQETGRPIVADQLKRFFEPKSVVVIGASGKTNKPGNDVIQNILANGYQGGLYLVNPKGGEILGRRVYRTIKELPDGIDLAIIILPASLNLEAIQEISQKGIQAAVLAAGGFSEVGKDGEQLQSRLVKTIQETGIRVIGPNTSGHISTPHNFTSSFFPLGKIPKGHISYIAQTGNFATHTMRHIMTEENFGVARVIGLGNKLDLDESEALEYLGQDDETKGIFVYLESFKRPRRFAEIARQVTKEKPVVLLKGGSTTEGAKAAVAHTAAMASDDRISDAVLRQAGVIRIYKYSHLFQVAKGLEFMPLPQGKRVGFLGPSGAMLVVLSDLCHQQLGLEVTHLEQATRNRLQEISPPFIRMRNPVDIWGAATVHGIEFGYREGMKALLNDSNIDAVVAILMLTEATGIPSLEFVVDLEKDYSQKPIYVTFTGDKSAVETGKAFLEERGIPTFRLIEEPFEVLSVLSRCRNAMDRF